MILNMREVAKGKSGELSKLRKFPIVVPEMSTHKY